MLKQFELHVDALEINLAVLVFQSHQINSNNNITKEVALRNPV